jgi:1,4-alpha-glucan branching enzyme
MSPRNPVVLALAAGFALPALAASQDGNVEWDGLSHAPWQERTPRVPMDGESFAVRFQSFRGDLTGASVVWNDGSGQGVAAASVVSSFGPYDVWEAVVPATAGDEVSYVIEATDGADSDYLGPDGVSDGQGPAWAIDFTTLSHAPYGSTPVEGGTVFRVWAPTRSTCDVRGEFNGWSTGDALSKIGEDFIGFVAGAGAGDMYKYYFNGGLWRTDARARLLVPTDNYNSVIVDPDSYEWQTEGFSPVPREQMVVYQLHVGTFAGRNDPAGPTPNPSGYIDVAERVQHLVDLGVNAVQLNPVNEFPGDFSGGYASVNAAAIESAYGDVDDFKAMVDALHGAGIAVLLDIVWNHVSISDNFLWDYDGTQIYFDSPHVDTPWGAQADFNNAKVRDFYLDSVDLFLDDYRLDGYRVDAVMYMVDGFLTPQWAPGQSIIRAMNDRIDRRYADGVSIAEKYDDDTWTVDDTPAFGGSGIGFDAQYHNRFKNELRGAVFGENAGGDPNMSAVASVIQGTGGSFADAAFNYFELHDDAWPLNGHERFVRVADPVQPSNNDKARGLQTLANSVALAARGVPAILQGTEWLEDDGWEANRLDWSLKTLNAGVVDYYSDLIATRTSEPALYANSPINVFHVNDAADVLAFERFEFDGRSFVAVVNLSPIDAGTYLLGMPRAGTWGVVVNNDAVEYDGDGFGPAPGGIVQTEPIPRDGFDQRVSLAIPGYGFLLLEHDPDMGCNPADLAEPFGTLDLSDVTGFVQAFSMQQSAADLDGNGIWDLADTLAFVDAFGAGCP